MSLLEQFCASKGIDPDYAMNLLVGIVSDNCVRIQDVATADQWRAVEYLKGVVK